MEIIAIEDKAFFLLLEKVIARLKVQPTEAADQWISGEEAMKMLRIKSKTTLQKLRDTGALRYSQPERKIILYDVASIHEYLNKNAQNTF
ncbi:helix-turn-helix domain-containing protein [Taibaiella koreensis]|uniref:helix-turn-helix domain-containing protein n=1 Tax=Taibaiella koreensis TaxID=1268548 RepID=UPI000E5A0924|nr:helix-turn-helix domain-containing protein [Taibaiella koreensis]